MTDIGEVLSDLATKIAEDLKGENITLDQRLDAFRILATYDAAVKKAKAKSSDDDDAPSFTSMKRNIQSVA